MFPALQTGGRKTALVFSRRSLSYEQLAGLAAAVAAGLSGARRAAVVADSTVETCVAVVGALLAGVPVLPLNPHSGSAELAHILGDAAPDVLLAADRGEVPEPLRGLETVTVGLDAPGRAVPPARDHGPDDPALIVYTSGTTGPPKGAVLPRRAIESNLDALAAAWRWSERDTVAHGLPLFHVHGLVIGILGPVRRGGTAVHVGRFSPEGIERALVGGATMVFGVPTMYRRLADAAQERPELARALGGARLLVSGSAPLPAVEHERLARLTGRPVVERYGLTETLMNTAVRADGEPAPGTVGPPLDGVQLRLVQDDGSAVATDDHDSIGEVQVRGPNVFLGYLNLPDATAGAFADGWFATGDVATRDERGYIRIVGRRATDLIKSGGYKIGAGEIESALREHPAVEDAAVTGEPDEDLGELVVAWVVLRPTAGADVAAGELIEHVAALLAPHKRPRVVHLLDELPRNELGKVQKKRLAPPSR